MPKIPQSKWQLSRFEKLCRYVGIEAQTKTPNFARQRTRMQILKLSTIIAILTLCLGGCAATGPRPDVDAENFGHVKTVTVVYPGQAVYEAGSASVPIILPVGGLIAAAAAGAATGAANASVSKAPATFNDLVNAKLGDTGLNRRFTDGIETLLRAHGYVVTEAQTGNSGLPTFMRDNQNKWHASGPQYHDSDAVLIVRVSPEYVAPGPLNSYGRMVIGEIVMFKSDTHEAIFRQRIYWQEFSDPYC
jgi:hypothetical protein